MKAQIKCSWDPERGEETKIVITPAFKELNRVEQLDFLNDIIGDLTTLYDETLAEPPQFKNGMVI